MRIPIPLIALMLTTACTQALEEAPITLAAPTAEVEAPTALETHSDWSNLDDFFATDTQLVLRAAEPARVLEDGTIATSQAIDLPVEHAVDFVYGVLQLDEIEGVGTCFVELRVRWWNHNMDRDQELLTYNTCSRAQFFNMRGEAPGEVRIESMGMAEEVRLRASTLGEEQRAACQEAINAWELPLDVTHTSTVHVGE